MIKDATIRARTTTQAKESAEKVFRKLGLSPSQAVNIFYQQVSLHKGFPFSLKIPNKKTRQVLDDSDNNKNLHECDSMEQLFSELGI